jgi:hypothetical protein
MQIHDQPHTVPAGKPIKLGLVGGSISCGELIPGTDERLSYLDHVAAALRRMFPRAAVSIKNGCIGGTGAALALACTRYSLDEDSDMVFVEYGMNGGYDVG